ncbi:MAG: hypothetical protein ACE5EO_02175 [Candidatus Krumholzibacteriia bacterium]
MATTRRFAIIARVPDRDLDSVLLERLLERELDAFRKALENESPGLSDKELERYMLAARKFSSHLLGARPRTRGRNPRGQSN